MFVIWKSKQTFCIKNVLKVVSQSTRQGSKHKY